MALDVTCVTCHSAISVVLSHMYDIFLCRTLIINLIVSKVSQNRDHFVTCQVLQICEGDRIVHLIALSTLVSIDNL